MKTKSIAVLVMAVLTLNVAVSTAYYNFFDPKMQEIREDFVSGDYSRMKMDCGEVEWDENNHPIPATCSGGVLERRDAYLNSRHVLRLGAWKTDRYLFDDRTFVGYFKYWF